MPPFRRLSAVCAVLFLPLLCSLGCQSTMRAKPAEGTGFVPMDQLQAQADLPFNKVWLKQGVDFETYRTICVAEVDTTHLLAATWWQTTFRPDKVEADARTVAAYMRQHLIDAFRADKAKHLAVVDTPEPGSLTLETALTELVPSNPVMGTLALAAPYGSGVVLQAAESQTDGAATVSFEARLRDTDTGEIVAMFADRENGKVAPINLNVLTWYGEAHAVIDDWSAEFVQVMDRRPGEVVKPASPFTLLPW
ncbi:MAG: DUF3313 domain-containing protein [Desulfovibrio sp.]|nr:DUF3313 domain-containing protein [Desulfovibrio sp.]